MTSPICLDMSAPEMITEPAGFQRLRNTHTEPALMKRLRAAFQFITILPAGKPVDFDPTGMIPFFPVVGLILGGMLAVFDLLVTQLWSPPVVAILDVLFLIWITGAFHIDGLGDMADGLYGNRPREKALAIMKDSRVGAMGLVAIVSGLAVKWGGISEMEAHRSLLLWVIPAFARGSMIFGFRYLPYGRPEGGTGHDFFKEKPKKAAFIGLLIPILFSLLAGWRGVLVILVFFMVTFGMLMFYKKRMGCITGDMLGAMSEITESALFLTAGLGAGL